MFEKDKYITIRVTKLGIYIQFCTESERFYFITGREQSP